MNPILTSPDISLREFLAQADQHAYEALQFLPAQTSSAAPIILAETREKVRVWLRTQFLFPSLLPWQQGLLVTLHWHRQTLAGLISVRQQDLPSHLQRQAEQLTRRTERTFMDLVAQTRVVLSPEPLSATQRAALEQEYLCVQCPDSAD